MIPWPTRLRRLALWAGSLVLVILANLAAPISILLGGSRGWGVVQTNDLAANAATGGHPREYISARAARARNNGKAWGCWLCKQLDSIDPNHCDKALSDPLGPFD